MKEVSFDEMADLLYAALNWVAHAKASTEVALEKLHEINRKIHLLKNDKRNPNSGR